MLLDGRHATMTVLTCLVIKHFFNFTKDGPQNRVQILTDCCLYRRRPHCSCNLIRIHPMFLDHRDMKRTTDTRDKTSFMKEVSTVTVAISGPVSAARALEVDGEYGV